MYMYIRVHHEGPVPVALAFACKMAPSFLSRVITVSSQQTATDYSIRKT